MKSCIAMVIFVCIAVIAQAQSDVKPPNAFTPKQKRWLDSLKSIHKLPAVAFVPQPALAYHTPVAVLPNDGEQAGMSGEDTIYKMKEDNMRLLKPNTTTTAIPNSEDGKTFVVPQVRKKP